MFFFFVLSKKPDNLNLLSNYSHEQQALLSQMKAPKRSFAGLHVPAVSGAGLSFRSTRTK